MKLASYATADEVRTALVVEDGAIDIASADPALRGSLVELLEGGDETLARVRAVADSGIEPTPLEHLVLAPPVRPRKFFAVGLNYADHVAESGLDAPEHLTVFAKAPTCVTGPFAPVDLPQVSPTLDYEGELGFVIGRRCRHVSVADAPDVIAGYLVVNDLSVREWQLQTTQWSLAKSFDTHGPIGPWLTTADEIGDPHALALRTLVNGEERQRSSTDQLIFSCFDIVAALSQACTLEPGDVVATGTPSGVAFAMDGQPWLTAGDVVRVEIDGLGAIENTVVEEQVPSAAGARAGQAQAG
jgi:2-keto-4-pentenoate hydratase/2-oxohepta-3-ene-1,7-dioic acid hydratase in catechol pathway